MFLSLNKIFKIKVKYSINNDGILLIYANIFNMRKEFLHEFTHILYKDEKLKLEKKELFQYLHVLPKNEVILSNNDKSTAKISKSIICYDYFDQSMKEKSKKDDDKKEVKLIALENDWMGECTMYEIFISYQKRYSKKKIFTIKPIKAFQNA